MPASDLEDLFAAIREAPDDDAPRMVLADRLIELGEPRGELIQLQRALAALEIGDSRRRALVARERELLRVPPNCGATYRAGFAEHVTLDAREAKHAVEWLAGELLIDGLRIEQCRGRSRDEWVWIGKAIEVVLERIRTLVFDDGEGWRCSAMLAALPPRPARLVDLRIPYNTVLPSGWER